MHLEWSVGPILGWGNRLPSMSFRIVENYAWGNRFRFAVSDFFRFRISGGLLRLLSPCFDAPSRGILLLHCTQLVLRTMSVSRLKTDACVHFLGGGRGVSLPCCRTTQYRCQRRGAQSGVDCPGLAEKSRSEGGNCGCLTFFCCLFRKWILAAGVGRVWFRFRIPGFGSPATEFASSTGAFTGID